MKEKTYTLLWCTLELRVGVRVVGAIQNFKTDFENSVIRPVFHR